ncbi:response regulator [Pontibacter cellulosilyticus]|uniref:Response regulator n=1 Tax=Pontibacter cellulosilyticus TaxID=1720253 RepID=A0A923N5D9_9BACT|nr:response regulator [Pontibacter cellulosilyticus]MBC5992464.1 response regulator [Pontibacter cellulosilyticus]
MKIYSIDDDHINNFLTERVLQEAGLPSLTRSYASAEVALADIVQTSREELPDIVFLDLNMPAMNGWQFLEALEPYKEKILGKSHIYILTSSLDTSDVKKSEDYELIDGFIHKPLTVEDVQVVLDEMNN